VQFSFYSSVSRVWQFTVGSLIYLLLSGGKELKVKRIRVVNITIVIIGFILLVNPIYLDARINTILATILAGLLVSFKQLDYLPTALSNAFIWLGDRSYSIFFRQRSYESSKSRGRRRSATSGCLRHVSKNSVYLCRWL
jgi:peptidoglycan/LPS O-acetylase OafA/YrhL